jgi:hypothetical protein
MGGNNELFKTDTRSMLGRMPWPDGGLTGGETGIGGGWCD